MKEHFSPQNEDLIKRLAGLKDAVPEYPAVLLKRRRAFFRYTVVAVTLPLVIAGIFKTLVGLLPHTSRAILETLLVSELAIAAGLGAYAYRDEIKVWLAPLTPTSTEMYITDTPFPTLTPLPNLTGTETATATPSLTPTEYPWSADATQKARPTDQGNHYGQTQEPHPNDK